MAKHKSGKFNRRGSFILLVCAVILAALLLLAFAFRGQLADFISSARSADTETEPWVFEQGSSQSFATMGDGFAVVSTTGIQTMNSRGYTLARHVFALAEPAVSACKSLALAYDIGGTTLRAVSSSGEMTTLDTTANILSANVNENGYFAVITDEPGYKGVVTVYDGGLSPIYRWYSGEGYALSARVSPDNRSLAVLTAGDEGGALHTFSLSSEAERGRFDAAAELFFDFCWLDSSRICAISEERLVFCNGDSALISEYGFEAYYLSDYSFTGEGFVALALSRYLSGSASRLVCLGTDGAVLGNMELERELKDLYAANRSVALLYSDGMTVYSRTLGRQGEEEDVTGVRRIFLRENGDVIFVYSSSASLISV